MEINFIAAATSRKPIATLTEFIQPPARGSCETSCGASASTKNGSAKTVENASIPTSGIFQSPCDAETRIVPTNGDVQVKDVSVNVSPISSAPTIPLPSPSLLRVRLSSFVKMPVGIGDLVRAEKIERKEQKDRRDQQVDPRIRRKKIDPRGADKDRQQHSEQRKCGDDPDRINRSPALMALARLPAAWFVKYETVIGIIGKTHGVKSDNAPSVAASHKNDQRSVVSGRWSVVG